MVQLSAHLRLVGKDELRPVLEDLGLAFEHRAVLERRRATAEDDIRALTAAAMDGAEDGLKRAAAVAERAQAMYEQTVAAVEARDAKTLDVLKVVESDLRALASTSRDQARLLEIPLYLLGDLLPRLEPPQARLQAEIERRVAAWREDKRRRPSWLARAGTWFRGLAG